MIRSDRSRLASGYFLRLLFLLVCASQTPPTSARATTTTSPKAPPPQSAAGPVLEGEAEILWKRAQQQIQSGKRREAVHTLRRLVQRIPTHPRAIESQRLLGEQELELENPREALEWFRLAENNLRGRGKESRELQRLRTRAYLALGLYSEGLLAAEKLLRDADSGKVRWSIDPQIDKTRALVHLNQLDRARSSLAAARKRELRHSINPSAAALWLQVLDLQIRTADCQSLPSSSTLEEDQVIDQMKRLADCTIEVRTLQKSLASVMGAERSFNERQALVEAEASWTRLRRHVEKACTSPPTPPGRRTPEELQTYLEELRTAIEPSCRKAMES